ncbi:Leucine-rich repeat-containing protein 1 [Hondaea fermentalgiana]|uniref:Leucine-rich repeat-containing protein 1 n=1 Tax=Hondaea fermentalgiana TaxID=2315210 RepID=A0A2R5GKB1_9STRA|nr:Leucine-rich repeat-containing protein 1 [Hondaea fermentalgiana]|eukprot:GBG31317.1 Leucine-rich repeat-containing protein 1 [Hondaea fermentalgiana]
MVDRRTRRHGTVDAQQTHALAVGSEANKSSDWSPSGKTGVVAMMLRHQLLLVVLLCTSALTNGASCSCNPSPCDGSSTSADCGSGIAEGEDHNTDVFEPALSSLTSLTYLFINNNELMDLPSSIGALTKLQKLYVEVTEAGRALWLQDMYKHTHERKHANNSHSHYNQLTSLPDSFSGLSELTTLCLQEMYKHTDERKHANNSNPQSNLLTALPESISGLTELTTLSSQSNQLTSLPDSISGLSELYNLEINDNKLTELPSSIGALTKMRYLYVKRPSEFLMSFVGYASGAYRGPTQNPSQNPSQNPTQNPTHQTQPTSQKTQSPPRLTAAEPTAINECHLCHTDESSAVPLALIVGPVAGAFVAVSVFAAVVIRRRRRAAKTEADENTKDAVAASAWDIHLEFES